MDAKDSFETREKNLVILRVGLKYDHGYDQGRLKPIKSEQNMAEKYNFISLTVNELKQHLWSQKQNVRGRKKKPKKKQLFS